MDIPQPPINPTLPPLVPFDSVSLERGVGGWGGRVRLKTARPAMQKTIFEPMNFS